MPSVKIARGRGGTVASATVLGAVLGAVLVATAGCGGPSATSRPPGTAPLAAWASAPLPALPPVAPVAWSSCPSDPSVQCGSVLVPLDYRHPAGASLRLSLTRAPALDPADPGGTLLFNPGGPGESGNQLLPVVLGQFPSAVRRRFAIVSFDPRGTGASDPLQCGTSPSALVSAPPVPAAAGLPLPGTPVFAAMASACSQLSATTAPYLDTIDTARDMDRIRQALGVSTVSYYGLSYGTVLGSVYAELFPHRVSTMVLDGAVDANDSLVDQADLQAPAAERSVVHLLTTCRSVGACPLGTDPVAFYTDLAASLRRHPLPAPGGGDRYPVTVGDLDTATLLAVTIPALTAPYESALVAARAGNGAPLRSIALELDTDLDGAPLVDPLWAITCNDAAVHAGPEEAGTLAYRLAARYPLLGGYAATYALGGCVAWPGARQPVVDLHPRGAPPILVIGNTGDPNTPLAGARQLTSAIPGARLLTWSGWGHTWLLSGAGDSCMQAAVSAYLGGGGLPAEGTDCP